MSVQRGTSSEIWHLDKLRHCDPKTARKMTRNGNGARHKQLAALAALEGGMAMVQPTEKRVSVHALPRTFLAHVSEESFARAERLKRAGMRNTDLFEYLLDAAERPAPVPAAILTNEAANIVKTVQERLRLPTQLDAVKRMSEAITNAEARARKIAELEGQLQEARDNVRKVTAEHATLIAEAKKATQSFPRLTINPPAPRPAVEAALLDFTAAFTGATATADPSGEVVVSVSQESLNALFPLWARAIEVLGLRRKEG